MKKTFIISIIVLLIAGGAYAFLNNRKVPTPETPKTPTETEATTEEETTEPEKTNEEPTNEISKEQVEEIAFDSCGPLSKYANQQWFPKLDKIYGEGDYLTDQLGGDGEGCLSKDNLYFVFIPDDFGRGHKCGQIFRFENGLGLPHQLLQTATGPTYCAFEFGKRIENYIEFTGNYQDSNFNCTKHNGKYFIKENRVEVEAGGACS